MATFQAFTASKAVRGVAKAAKKMRRNYEFRVRAKAANILMFLSRFGPAALLPMFSTTKMFKLSAQKYLRTQTQPCSRATISVDMLV